MKSKNNDYVIIMPSFLSGNLSWVHDLNLFRPEIALCQMVTDCDNESRTARDVPVTVKKKK